MSSRPRGWEPLHDGDPIPGDPYEVARLGKNLRKMADEIEKQANNIRALASVEGWDSEAGKEFHEIADGASGRLRRAFDRYDEAAKALGTKVVEGGESKEYASELHRAQKIADKALREYREAETDHKGAVTGLDKYEDTVPSKDDVTERTRLEKKRDESMDVIRRCHSEIGRAKIIRDDAASAAAKHIKNVVHHDGVRDPGGFMNFLADWADFFANLSAIFSVLAVICAFVPPAIPGTAIRSTLCDNKCCSTGRTCLRHDCARRGVQRDETLLRCLGCHARPWRAEGVPGDQGPQGSVQVAGHPLQRR